MTEEWYPPVSPLSAGLGCKCPRCGRGRLFAGFLTVAEKCEACGLELAKHDSGDGPAVFVILILGFIVVGLALWVELRYEPDALLGEQAALLALSKYRRIGRTRFFPIYAGVTAEAGNVWERRSQMSFSDLRYAGAAFIGIDTVLGPVYLAYGRAQGGHDSFYFYLGNPFELRRR